MSLVASADAWDVFRRASSPSVAVVAVARSATTRAPPETATATAVPDETGASGIDGSTTDRNDTVEYSIDSDQTTLRPDEGVVRTSPASRYRTGAGTGHSNPGGRNP